MTDTEQARPAGKASALSGMKEICAYVGKSEKTVRKYITQEGFPASKLAGAWESDTALIEQWRVDRIRTQYLIGHRENDKANP